MATNLASKVSLVTHAFEMSRLIRTSAGSRRWVIDSGSCVGIVGEGTVLDNEKKSTEDIHASMRLNTTSGEVIASNRLTVPLRSSTSADVLVMIGVLG